MKYLLSLLFVCSLHPRAAGCAYYVLGEDYRIALLNPYLIGDDYQAFFYSSAKFYRFENASAGRDRLRNAASWVRELGDKVSTDDVMEMLYRTPFSDYVAARDSNATNQLSRNAAWRAVVQQPELLRYLMWAKAYETPHDPDPYAWGGSEKQRVADQTYYRDFQQRARTGYDAVMPGTFLRHRYAYQLLLLARYSGDEQALDRLYKEQFAGKNDVLSDWARYHYATQWNDPARTVIELARAFRVTPEKALAVFQNTPVGLDPSDYLRAATTDEERSDLYVLAAVKQPGKALDYLEKAYRYNRNNEVIPLLIVREINKLEDWLMSYRLTDNGPTNATAPDWDTYPTTVQYAAEKERLRRLNAVEDRKYLAEVRAFVNTYAPNYAKVGLTEEKADLFRAQLALLADDYRSAADQLQGYSPTDSLTQLQFGIDRFLVQLQGKSPDRDQLALLLTELLPYFQSLEKPSQPLEALNRTAAQTFAAAGDTLTAYFFQVKSLPLLSGSGWNSQYYDYLDYLDRPISIRTMNDIIAAIEQPQPTPFFEYAIGEPKPRWEGDAYSMSSTANWVNALRDLAGTQAMRRNDVELATRYFDAVTPGFYKETYDFSRYVYGSVAGIYAVNPRLTTGAATKAYLARRLLSYLKAKQLPSTLTHIGDIWYGMSYFGPEWMMLSYEKSVYPPDGPQAWPSPGATPTTSADYDLFYRADRAEQYWKEARQATDDPELLAELDFKLTMLDWQRQRMKLSRDYYSGDAQYDSLYRARFDGYADRQIDTDFFGKVAHQCSWFNNRYGG